MTPEQFAYWLQGFVEMNGSRPNEQQWKQIKNHLQCVFTKITPKVEPVKIPDIQMPEIKIPNIIVNETHSKGNRRFC